MSAIRVAILGAGGFAREVWWALQHAHAHESVMRFQPVMFVDQHAHAAPLKGLPVRTLQDVPKDVRLICGIGGMTDLKERVVRDALSAGYAFAPAVVSDDARVGPDVRIGVGTILCAGVIVTTDVTIGEHVAFNLDCTVGHDTVVHDFVTASPGCHVSGCVTLGHGAYLGTGASILEHVAIGDHAVLGAGAVATKDVPAHALAVGVPAAIKKMRNAA
jgi:sugar O-acyltransferase (sialic acid O-acetyltransferase NeuD family)